MKQSKHYYTPFITTLFLLLIGHGVWGQVWTYNFGNSTGSFTSSTASTNFLPTPGSGTARVRVGTNPGSISLENPGLANLGTDSELKITSNTGSTSTTKFSVYDYVASKIGCLKFSISMNGGTNGVYNLTLGDGASFSDNNAMATAQSLVGMSWSLSTSNSVAFSVLNGSTFGNTGVSNSSTLFSQGTSNIYNIEVYFNNESSTKNYSRGGITYNINSSKWDLWINGVLIGDDLAKGGISSNVNIDSFAFNHQVSSSTPGSIYIDDIEYSNLLPTSTTYTTSWSNNLPTSSIDAIIDGDLISTADISCKNLTINAGKSLTISSADRLTVNGNITNNGTLTLESGATLVQGTGNTASGTGVYNVQQALTGGGGSTPNGRFWYMGSPLSGASSTAFDAAGDNRLWTYAEATQSYTEITTNGVAMSPIQGHVARLGASSTVNFTGGAINSGSFTNNSLTNTGTGSTRGYTLISNPYPSFLDWDLIAAGATGIATSLWFRTNDGSSMVYDTYNATGGVSTLNSGVTTNPRYIPPMQAFWVYNPTDGTTGSLTISNSMRSHQTNGGLKDATDFPAFVRLNLENDAAIDQTVLYFDNNAAAGYDNFDSDKMLVPNTAQVYTFVGNKKLAINGMKSVKANKQVPLTVEFPTAKAYAFNATEVAMTDGIVLLEDRLKKVFQDLTMNPVYEFEAAAGTDADRFVVHFQANGGVAGIETAEDNGIAIVSNATGLVTITLSEELPAMGTIQIIDANGKVIATQAINEQATTMNINAATGIYHVLVDTSSKIARKKIVITK